jgi:hypothetical protein
MLGALYYSQRRFSDAEPFLKHSLSAKEKVFGTDNPAVVLSLNNLAALYFEQRRYGDALHIIRKTISQGTFAKDVAFPVLFQSRTQQLIGSPEALAYSYDVLQRALKLNWRKISL